MYNFKNTVAFGSRYCYNEKAQKTEFLEYF